MVNIELGDRGLLWEVAIFFPSPDYDDNFTKATVEPERGRQRNSKAEPETVTITETDSRNRDKDIGRDQDNKNKEETETRPEKIQIIFSKA